MRELKFKVPESLNGIKVKSFLRIYCGVSARLLIRLKKTPSGILKNGSPVRTIDILQTEDVVSIQILENREPVPPVPIPLHVLYEDEDILAVAKDSNMPIHPSPGHDCDTLANAVAQYFQQTGKSCPLRAVYRLDKDTSGIVLIAKNSYVAFALSEKVKKIYTAICEGILQGEGTIDAPIRIKEGHGIQREVGEGGVHAITHWKAEKSGKCHTLLKLQLETGRTHQIRVHMSNLGHPLAGDDMYGGSKQFISRQALHCGYVEFIHPICKKTIILEMPLPKDMQNLCQKTVLIP